MISLTFIYECLLTSFTMLYSTLLRILSCPLRNSCIIFSDGVANFVYSFMKWTNYSSHVSSTSLFYNFSRKAGPVRPKICKLSLGSLSLSNAFYHIRYVKEHERKVVIQTYLPKIAHLTILKNQDWQIFQKRRQRFKKNKGFVFLSIALWRLKRFGLSLA